MLPSARRRQQETAAREAAGESVWTTDFDEQILVRIRAAWTAFDNTMDLGGQIATIMRNQGGWDFGRHIDARSFTSELKPEVRIDMLASLVMAVSVQLGSDVADKLVSILNSLMNEHRVAYKFVERELIGFESDELLKSVVEPALRLLVGGTFQAAHGAYLAALKEDDPSDAITDAGTALQETLTALGCKGNALGPLIKDAKKNGLLAGHDQNLVDGVAKFMEWASADRSESGDGHKHSDANRADAWLMIHVVGALIVRLADPARRGSTA